jgi:hypothetical protein
VLGKAYLLSKRQLFRPVSSLSRGAFAGNCSMVHWALDIRLRDFLSMLLLKPHKGSGAVEGLFNREGEHFLGWDRHVGNEGL